jgi:Amt family ammonium transporter
LIRDYIAHLDGFTEIPGGWVNRNFIQLAYQLADSVAGFSYSFVMTCLILFLMNLVPGLSLRVSAEEEEMGLDDGELGEFAYDYVEIKRHVDGSLTGGSGSPSHSIKGTSPDKTV